MDMCVSPFFCVMLSCVGKHPVSITTFNRMNFYEEFQVFICNDADTVAISL